MALAPMLASLAIRAAPPPASVSRTTTVVRADPRTGRLVRSVVVPPRPGLSRSVAPRMVSTQPAPPPGADSTAGVAAMVEEAARRHSLDPLLVHSVIQVESAYNPLAISPKGAEGLMQLLPSTARRLGVANSFDLRENIEAGTRHLKELKDRFHDTRLALAAYNAGEGAVARYKTIPPYQETQNYVYKVGKRWGELRKSAPPASPSTAKPASDAAATSDHRPLEAFVDSEGRLHLRTK